MPEYTYIDTRLLWLLMFLATGAVQYLLIGAVKLVMTWTRERKPVSPPVSTIVLLEDLRKERQG